MTATRTPQPSSAAFGNAFRALGGQVAAITQIQKGDADMADVLAEIAAAGPDGIFFPLFEVEGSPFAQQVREFEGLEDATLITGESLLALGVYQPAAFRRHLLCRAGDKSRRELQWGHRQDRRRSARRL